MSRDLLRAKRALLRFAVLASFCFAAPVLMYSQCSSPGCLDGSFGPTANGEVLTVLSGSAYSAPAMQSIRNPDGTISYKIVVAATTYLNNTPYMSVARYNLDGILDTGFGSSGLVITNVQGYAQGLAIQPDGKIIVAGFYSVVLIRLNADGSLDSNFGSGGIVNVAGGQGYAIAIQGDGKIVVGGSMNASSTVTSMAAWRFNADGSLDSSFGSGGQATLSFGRNISSRALAIATQKVPIFGGTEQRILLGGWHDGKTADDFALARLDAAGQTDASFGSGGAVSKDFFGNTDTIRSVQVDSQNRILVAGSALKPGTKNGTSFTDFALVRYGVNGAVDPSFGSSGSVVTQVSGSTNTLAGAVIQVNGNIVAAGRTSLGLTLVRYTSTGAPDASFGVNGVAAANFLDLGATGMSAAGVVLQQDGKILAIGTATTPPGSTVCLSRFYP